MEILGYNLDEFLAWVGEDIDTVMMLIWILPVIIFVFYGQRIQLIISSNEIKKDIGKLDEYTTSTKKDYLNYVKNNLTYKSDPSKKLDSLFFITGRSLLGLYFIAPGLSKVFDFASTLALMRMKGVPISLVLLPLTIVIQLLGGILLILGKNLRLTAFMLFGLTILINVFIHNFWALNGDPSQAHETQNFVKNLAIAAGLLVLATKDKS